jgi:predicted dehydrogenase
MKQIIQSYKNGELVLEEIPSPACPAGFVKIRTSASLVSAGTEKLMTSLAKKSLVGKARSRPDLVRRTLQKMRQEGVLSTLEQVRSRLDSPVPLGYSCAGVVVEVGDGVDDLALGQRVACAGAGYANHAEENVVPRNLCVSVPEKVADEEAAFATVAAIALQGVRQLDPTIGERVVVIGLGLVGQITCQLLAANGCRVIGSDFDPHKRELATRLGLERAVAPDELVQAALEFSGGYGADGVVVAASTPSNQPLVDAAEVSRLKGRVVVVGLVGMDVPRDDYYRKELDLRLSMSYGPGRYDPTYEEGGADYPFAYVRWTEQRNMEAFLDLVALGRVDVRSLITHRVDFRDALSAYDLMDRGDEPYVGIVLAYGAEAEQRPERSVELAEHRPVQPTHELVAGFLGSGAFARNVLLPALARVDGVRLHTLCSQRGISSVHYGRKLGFERASTSEQEVFESDEMNAVLIATRHGDHARQVIAGLEHGKHVYVEKPLCLTRDELSAVRDAAVQARSVLQVGFNRRFAPAIARIADHTSGHGPLQIVYRVNAGRIPIDHWTRDPEAGGGRIVGEVCHFVDTCMHLAGARPLAVEAAAASLGRADLPDDDAITATLRFDNGSIATIVYTALGSPSLEKEYLEVFADGVAARMTNYRELVLYGSRGARKVKRLDTSKGFREELTHFAAAARGEREPVPFDQWLDAMDATFAIVESLRENRPVELSR